MDKHFRSVAGIILLLFFTAISVGSAFATGDPCNISPGTCRTQTQGGWHTACHGGNPGCVRDANFATAFPTGLTVGGTFTIHFTSSATVAAFLPGTSTPGVLDSNHVNPTSTEAGVFAGQVVALALSLGFSNHGVPTFCANLGDLVVPHGVHTPAGAFAGWSVNQIFALANLVLGGNTALLPTGINLSDLNGVVDAINGNFDDGTHSEGYLVEPDCDQILPVELTSFSAVGAVDQVNLSWTTASEHNIAAYNLDRQGSDGTWHSLATVTGMGDNPTGHSYGYQDADVIAGTAYSYRLKAREMDGSIHPLGLAVSATPRAEATPVYYSLAQNYPNPFNPSTTIAFDLVEKGNVTLKVYNLMGQEVASLVNGSMNAGHNVVNFDATNLSSGIYLYRLTTNGFVAERKMLLMK